MDGVRARTPPTPPSRCRAETTPRHSATPLSAETIKFRWEHKSQIIHNCKLWFEVILEKICLAPNFFKITSNQSIKMMYVLDSVPSSELNNPSWQGWRSHRAAAFILYFQLPCKIYAKIKLLLAWNFPSKPSAIYQKLKFWWQTFATLASARHFCAVALR